MPMCMHLVLIASRAQSVPVSQRGGKQLKSTMTSTARAAGLASASEAERPASQARASQGSHKARASAAERPASQARASQGSHKVTRKFSTFCTFSYK
jgi:hypothetical protein